MIRNMEIPAAIFFVMTIATKLLAQQVEPARYIAAPKSVCFRIDTDIYAKETDPPIHQFKTYFTDSQTIETDIDEKNLVRVLDLGQNSMTVADRNRRLAFTIELATLESMVVELKSLLDQNTSKKFTPQPIRSLSDNRVSIENEVVAYEAKLEPGPFPELTERYLTFVDWSKKLSAVFPPNEPPQIRLDLNAHLMQKKLLPVELKRTNKAAKIKDEIVAKILFGNSTSPNDSAQADRILRSLSEYKLVSHDVFFQ